MNITALGNQGFLDHFTDFWQPFRFVVKSSFGSTAFGAWSALRLTFTINLPSPRERGTKNIYNTKTVILSLKAANDASAGLVARRSSSVAWTAVLEPSISPTVGPVAWPGRASDHGPQTNVLYCDRTEEHNTYE